jgi:amidase
MPLKRPDRDDLSRLARINHFSLDDDEAEQYSRVFAHFLPRLDELDDADDVSPVTDTAGRRDLGRPEADPLNAIIRGCSVPPTGEGPLTGFRVGVKDSISVAGLPLTMGSDVVEFVPRHDATLVQRLLAAGATITAVVNMDSFAHSGAGDTSDYGPTRNPYDIGRLAGGSSGGSAAALAYEEIDLTIGGDQGGSIRIPASWCGVVGIKPTHGLIPYTGVLGLDHTFDHAGPLARSVGEVAAALSVLAGRDEGDPRQRGISDEDFAHALDERGIKGLRIGVLAEGFDFPESDPEVSACVRDAIEALRAQGAEPVEVSLPLHHRIGGVIWGLFAESVAATLQTNGTGYYWQGLYDPALSETFGKALQARADRLPPQGKFESMLGTYLQRDHHGRFYAKSQNLRPRIKAAYDDLLRDVDLIAMPATPMTAHRYREDLGIAERIIEGWNMLGNTAPFNMTGHPSLSVPCGMVRGMPVGLMLTGRHFEDGTVLAAARAVEDDRGILLRPRPAAELAAGTR